jgi:hypothetical protein
MLVMRTTLIKKLYYENEVIMKFVRTIITITPVLLIMAAVPHALRAMESNTPTPATESRSWSRVIFSKPTLAVGAAVGAATWVTWSPERTQSVQDLMTSASNNKGKVLLGGLLVAGALYGISKLFSSKLE